MEAARRLPPPDVPEEALKLAREPERPHLRARRSHVEDFYPVWVRNTRLRATDMAHLRDEARGFEYAPPIGILMPMRDPERDRLERALDSVMSQIYANWELRVCTDSSTGKHAREVLSRYGRLDRRIKVAHLEQDGDTCRATNQALSLAEGEYVGLLDHDDELAPNALYEMVKLFQEHRDTGLVYSDEDRIDAAGDRHTPHFKPDWSPELLLSCDYTSHFSLYRRGLLEEIGGLREGFDGWYGYDLALHATERAGEIHHVPKVLYHRRGEPSEDSGSQTEGARRALAEALERRGMQGSVEDGLVPESFRVKPKVEDAPKVSVIIPTRDNISMLRRCVESIERLTSYPNYEILIVDNNSADPETVEYLSSSPHQVVPFREEFNYSKINNFAVARAGGEYVVLLNDDTEVVSGEWMEAMLEHAQREEVGAVGAKLVYPNGRIQHAGVLVGVGSPWGPRVATHSHQHYPADSPGHAGALQTIRNYSAATAACMMVRKSVYEEVGGLDEEKLRISFNDVDLCLKMRERGYRIVYTPYAELHHYESASRPHKSDLEEILHMRERWGAALDIDPYYNSNFSLGSGDFNLNSAKLRPRVLLPKGEELRKLFEEAYKHPLLMEGEERRAYMDIQRANARNSNKTALVPAQTKSYLELVLSAVEHPNGQRRQGNPAATGPHIERREQMSPPPFFIVGQPKSGTSWVQFTLHTHPEIVCLGEGKFFGRDFKKNNPSSGGWLPSLYSLFADSEDFKSWAKEAGPWVRSSPERLEEDRERHVKGLTRAAMNYFFADARSQFNKPIVGDKTPAHISYLNEIHEFYPDAKIIHVIRDGRDHAVSSVFHWWKNAGENDDVFSLPPEVRQKREAYYKDRGSFGPDKESIFEEGYLRGLAKNWKEILSEAMETGPRLFGDRYLEVRYEDLLLDPQAHFTKIMRFLGASTEREIVEKCIRRNSFERRSENRARGVEDPNSFYRKGISGDWKNYFTERDERIFDEEAGEFLARLVYERSEPRASVRRDEELSPPEGLHHVGGGDFKKTGERWLRIFTELCDLKPGERVLDAGCGIGRMAVPLTGYLSIEGSYEGFDIVSEGVKWCRENITPRYPNFRFQVADVHNDRYHPEGTQKASEYRFPYPDGSFDFVFLTSVFTHMLPQDMENYLSEISRVLKSGGRCLLTWFLLNDESLGLIEAGKSDLNFKWEIEPGCRTANKNLPEAAVAYDEVHARELYKRYRLEIAESIRYGSWCNRSIFFDRQDIIVATKV